MNTRLSILIACLVITTSSTRAQTSIDITIKLTPDQQNTLVNGSWQCLKDQPFACADLTGWLRRLVSEAQAEAAKPKGENK